MRDSAQAAIDNGDEFNFEDLGVDTSRTEALQRNIRGCLKTGSVFEFAPAYDMDEEEYADGQSFACLFVLTAIEGYQITGDEDIIFLYINDSDARK